MTEEEAKKKWCPMTRFHRGYDGDVYTNKISGSAKEDDCTLCVASDCMLWQEEKVIKGFKPIYDSNENLCGYNAETEVIGYCGLGGKP